MVRNKLSQLGAFLLLAALLSARGGGSGGKGPNDFTLSLNPTSLTVNQGESGTTTLTLTPQNGFSGTVSLSAVNPPDGITVRFNPSSLNVPGQTRSTVTVEVGTSVRPGTYTLTLKAASDSIQRTATLTLTVSQVTTFIVNTTDDTIDVSPGDGICADANDKCSLRAAIMEANALKTPAVIIIPAGTYKLTRTSTADEQGGDLDIKSNVTLRGAGAGQTILDGNGADRVLQIYKGATVRVEGVTIQNGEAGEGGGIYNEGSLTLTNTTVSGNTAAPTGPLLGGSGGGIYNAGTLTLTNSTVSENTATDLFGGRGGGIYNEGSLTLTNSTVSGNKAGSGGGILNGGTLTLTNSTVSGNTGCGIDNGGSLTLTNSTVSGNTGGGISNSGGTLTLTNSTVSGNTGGGIFNSNRGTLTLTNSTVSGNKAGRGGGIYNIGSGTLTLINSTVSGNTATGEYGGGGIANAGSANLSFSTITNNQATSGGGGIRIYSGAVKLKGVILANNTSGTGPECSGSLISHGYNLIKNIADCGFTVHPTDILNKDPLLGPLADNGGPTKTHLPAANSPVLDRVPSQECTALDGKVLSTDQRGVSRPQGTACDIGAVER